MNHHKIQSLPAGSPCRAGDVISIDQTGWGVTSGKHWDYHDGLETPYDDLFLMPQEQRQVPNEDGTTVSQLYIGWEMPNGIKVGRDGGQTGNWWLSRRKSELNDRWYTMNKSYQDALDYAGGTAYAGQGAGVNLSNHTALTFTAENPVGVALHDVWPHETGQPFAISVFRGLVRVRIKQEANIPIPIGQSVSKTPFQHYAQVSAGNSPTLIGYTLTSSPAESFVQYPMLEVIMRR